MIIGMGAHGQPLPPKGYAGVERVVTWWIAELRRRGHEVVLIHHDSSSVEVDGLVGLMGNDRDRYYKSFAYARDKFGVNVIHDNNDHHPPRPERWGGDARAPYIFTVHACVWEGNPCPVFLSHHQARWFRYRERAGRAPTVVHNGLPSDAYRFSSDKEDFVFWCASIRACKAPELAVEVCREAGVRLVMAGPIQDGAYGWLNKYRTERDGLLYLGPLGDERLDWFARAGAFLYTCSEDWMEGYNLTNIEALLSGTPVIALETANNQVAREQIVHGESGFICPDGEAMRAVLADGAWRRLSPGACLAYGKLHSVERAVDGYLDAYERAVKGEVW